MDYNELFVHDPDSGHLVWKERPRSHFKTQRGWRIFNTQKAGKRAGAVCHVGRGRKYNVVNIGKKLHYVHRVVWQMYNGEWPTEIDHIDGDTLNNRIENLREVSRLENSRNAGMRRTRQKGMVGVHKHSAASTWVVSITNRGKSVHVGCFRDYFEAACARKSAELRMGFHGNHGRLVVTHAD